MSNCKHVTRLLSDALDRTLSAEEEARINEHLKTCPACKNCREHFLRLKIWRAAVHGKTVSQEP